MMQSVRFVVALAIAGAVFGSSAHAGWTQSHKLTPDDGAADDRFGWSVALSGNTALVGSITDDDNGGSSGSAYLFVPEPAGIVLLGLAALALTRRRG